jgi:hypothetical protein
MVDLPIVLACYHSRDYLCWVLTGTEQDIMVLTSS